MIPRHLIEELRKQPLTIWDIADVVPCSEKKARRLLGEIQEQYPLRFEGFDEDDMAVQIATEDD